MAEVARLTQEGNLLIAGEYNTRIPPITDGLIQCYPLDGVGGCVDIIGGYQACDNLETGVNLIDAMYLDWRDPASWTFAAGGAQNLSWDESKQALKFRGNNYAMLKTPVVVDPTKLYEIEIEVMVEVRNGPSGFYLGGELKNAANVDVTQNFDYTLATNQMPTLNQWVTYRLTRTGTSVMANATRTSLTSTTGWTGDLGGGGDLLGKFYYIGGLFNYQGDSNAVMYVRRLSVINRGLPTTTALSLDDGLCVHTGLSNIISNPGSFSTWTLTSNTSVLNERFVTGSLSGEICRICADTATATVSANTPLFDVSASDYLSITFFARKISGSGNIMNIDLDAYSDAGGTTHVNVTPSAEAVTITADLGEWALYNANFQVHATAIKAKLYFYHSAYRNIDYDIALVSMDKKKYTSPYTNITKAWGNAKLPFVFSPNMTILFKFKSFRKLNQVIDANSSPKLIQFGDYYTNASLTFWYYVDAARLFIKGMTGSDWQDGGTQIKVLSSNEFNSEQNWALSFSGSTGWENVSFYLNGELVGSRVISPAITSLSSNFIVLDGISEGIYRDLWTYQRVLTATEIREMHKNPVVIKPTGDVVATYIKQQPEIPSDCYYFPLGESATSICGTNSPYQQENLVYEDGFTSISPARTNLAPLITAFTAIHYASRTATTNTTLDTSFGNSIACVETKCIDLSGADNAFRYESASFITILPNRVMTFSFYVMASFDNYLLYPNSGDSWHCSIDWYDVGNVFISRSTFASAESVKKFKWSKKTIIGVSPSNAAKCILRIGNDNGNFPAVGTIVYIGGVVFCYGYHSPKFFTGSTSDAKLSYNLYSDIGLDWNADWTLIWWKIPLDSHGSGTAATVSTALSGYSIESLGCNSNSLGGSYAYFGKTSGSDNLCLYFPGFSVIHALLNMSCYYNHLIPHVLHKSGNTITFSVYQKTGIVTLTSSAVPTINPNGFVTQYGYDFKFAGWDNNSLIQAKYRDLIVAKRALTQTELDSIIKQKLYYNSKPGVLQVSQEIFNKEVL